MFPVALGISLLLLQAQTVVYGAGIVPPSARRIPGFRLRGRNLPVIPAACSTGCTPFAPFLTGESCPVTECCSTIFQEGYFECFKCVGTTTNATDFSIAQEYVDVVTTSCISEGFHLPVLTLPGQNPDRTLVSALPPGASGIAVFPAETVSVVRSSPPSTAPPRSSAVTVSHVSSSQSGFSVGVSRGPSNSVSHVSSSQSGLSVGVSSAPQSSATAPPPQSTSAPSSAPSPTSSAPPSAGVRSQVYTPVIGVVVTAFLALLV